MKRLKTAVIGLGNLLMGDDGAGLHALYQLTPMLKDKNIDIIEGGTFGMNLIHQFDRREKIIFIDSGNCGLKPGQYRRFYPEDVVTQKKINGYSLHQFDLMKIIDLVKALKIAEKVAIVIYCIQPGEIKMTDELSLPVKKSLPFIIQEVYNELIRGEP